MYSRERRFSAGSYVAGFLTAGVLAVAGGVYGISKAGDEVSRSRARENEAKQSANEVITKANDYIERAQALIDNAKNYDVMITPIDCSTQKGVGVATTFWLKEGQAISILGSTVVVKKEAFIIKNGGDEDKAYSEALIVKDPRGPERYTLDNRTSSGDGGNYFRLTGDCFAR